MTIFRFGKQLNLDNIVRLENQNVNSDVLPDSPVYIDSSGIWQNANLFTITPQGVYDGTSIIVEGALVTTGLAKDIDYYLDSRRKQSNANSLNDDCSSLTSWTDNDTGDGISTQTTFDSKSVFKFDSGTAGGANDAARLINVGVLGSTWAVTINMFFQSIGTLADSGHVNLIIKDGGINFNPKFASEGLFIHDGATNNEVGTNLIVQNTWQTWTFEVDSTTPASATCDVYLDGILVKAKVDCSLTTGITPDGDLEFTQFGVTAANNISYVDFIKVGSALEIIPALTTKESGTKIGRAVSTTELMVDIETIGVVGSNAVSGYQLNDGAAPTSTSINKLTYSTEFTGLISSVVDNQRSQSGMASSLTNGYCFGGIPSPGNSSIQKLTFSNEFYSTIVSILPVGVLGNTASSQNKDNGYYAGGENPTKISSIIKFRFLEENTATLTSDLNAIMTHSVGNESDNASYFVGGSGLDTSAVNKLVFAGEASQVITSKSATAKGYRAGVTDGISGYTAGGSISGFSDIEKLVFSTETMFDVTNNLNHDTDSFSGASARSDGYLIAGRSPAPANYSSIQKLTFITESVNTLSSVLDDDKFYVSVLEN